MSKRRLLNRRGSWNYAIWFAAISLLLFVLMDFLGQSAATAETSSKLLERGKTVFDRECVVCHGEKGEGNGKAAYLLFPKPRDFTLGSFKVRSTPSGEPPQDKDIFNSISNGLPGSAMPSFVSISEDDRWALVEYLKKLAEIDSEPERIITVPLEPDMTPETPALGKALYDKLKCWECHGENGDGYGPSRSSLKDDSGFPAPANDFTRGIYKGGGKNSDIYLRFTTGMDGSAMPSYEESANEAERWTLVRYVKSLAGLKTVSQPGTGVLTARKVKGNIGTDPNSGIWAKASTVEIPLMALWQGIPATSSVKVKALHNRKEIALLLEWDDPEPAGGFTRHQDYTDAAAVMFPLLSDPPLFTMGEKDKPVNIWHWRMDRQLDMSKFQDVEDIYPNMVADEYQFASGYYPKSIEKPGHTPIAESTSDPTFVAGVAVGNYNSGPNRLSAVEDLYAEGFGTLTTQGADGQNVKGQGMWINGSWRVCFVRKLKSGESADVDLKPGATVPIAFAVWDGNVGDRDGQKAVTTWYELNLE